MKKRWMAHACLQRSSSLTRANPVTVANEIESKQGEAVMAQHKDAGFGMASRGGGSLEGPVHLARAGEIVLVNAAWQMGDRHNRKNRELYRG
jgi:hypothetical protein